ncbi:MAG: enoyl-CoA hydratase/isomerase family protein [Anaerolineales bacterium]|jgi:enoyl-CoA hydratase/carnithine racemase
MISVEYRNNVALVKLDRGVTNAIHLQLVDELDGALQRIKRDSRTRALVLLSANDKFFSIGFDIPSLFGLSMEDFLGFYQAFNRVCLELYTFPKPTVAAVTGHAIAGGCILALCCDYRFIAEGRRLMGLNEIKLGVPVPYTADCVLRDLVGVRVARDVMEGGEFYQPEDAFQMGMVDRICPPEKVLTQAVEKAKVLSAFSQQAYTLIKRNRVEQIEEYIKAHLKAKERLFVDRWYSEEARELLREAMEKF